MYRIGKYLAAACFVCAFGALGTNADAQEYGTTIYHSVGSQTHVVSPPVIYHSAPAPNVVYRSYVQPQPVVHYQYRPQVQRVVQPRYQRPATRFRAMSSRARSWEPRIDASDVFDFVMDLYH